MDKQSYGELLKKLNELNLAFIKCRQNVEVPEIILQFDQKVKEICQRARSTVRGVFVLGLWLEFASN